MARSRWWVALPRTISHLVVSSGPQASPAPPTPQYRAALRLPWPGLPSPDCPAQPPPTPSSMGDEVGEEALQYTRLAVLEVAQEVLGHPLRPHQSLVACGFDSLTSVAFRDALQLRVRRPLPSSLVFDHPTAEAVAQFVVRQGPGRPPPPSVLDRRPPLPGRHVALVSTACRLPKADTPDTFWALLEGGVDCVGLVPLERWCLDAVYAPDPAGEPKTYCQYGAFVEDVDLFDPVPFDISLAEAQCMAPHQRLLLETTREALLQADILSVVQDFPQWEVMVATTTFTIFLGQWNFSRFKIAVPLPPV